VTTLGVGGGLVPPSPRQGRACMHAILPMWTEVKASSHKHGSILYTGCGRWSRAMLPSDLALGGRGYLAGPPPIDWVVHARYHPPILNLIFNATGI
jgi:hypothetical protein